MSFPSRLLTEGEDIILDLRPHWVALVTPAFWTIVIGSVAGVVWLFAPEGSAQDTVRLVAVLIAFLLWIPLAAVPAMRWRFTMFVLTNERVITRSGVIAKRGKELPLETINDVTFNQSIVERILGAGNLVIESAGETGQNRFTDIRRPEHVQLEIYRAAESRKGIDRLAAGAGGVSAAEEIGRLADLRDRGVLTPEEFEARKRRLLEG